jgi:sterol desaturase/sphingolipid hydroxylase (fatty acid hydroxylase superfamily)
MSDYLIKSLLAVLLLGAGLTAFLSMMARFGRPGDEVRAARLRKIHKAAGYVYIVLLAPLAFFGAKFLAEMGDGLSVRGTLHFVLAMTLLAILFLKFLTVRTHRQLMKNAPALGMTLFSLTLIIFLITAGYFFLQTAAGK